MQPANLASYLVQGHLAYAQGAQAKSVVIDPQPFVTVPPFLLQGKTALYEIATARCVGEMILVAARLMAVELRVMR